MFACLPAGHSAVGEKERFYFIDIINLFFLLQKLKRHKAVALNKKLIKSLKVVYCVTYPRLFIILLISRKSFVTFGFHPTYLGYPTLTRHIYLQNFIY